MQRAERNAAAADSIRLFTRLLFLAKRRGEIVIEMFNEARQIRHEYQKAEKILKMIATYPSRQLLYLILAGERLRNLIYNC